jgi:hypothetical protein
MSSDKIKQQQQIGEGELVKWHKQVKTGKLGENPSFSFPHQTSGYILISTVSSTSLYTHVCTCRDFV